MYMHLLILFAASLLISSIGFYRVVYFISIGYAFSIVVMAAFTLVAYYQKLTPVTLGANLMYIWWGLRLGVFLIKRERRDSYRKELSGVHERSGSMSPVVKFIIWVSVCLLYVAMYSPVLFLLEAEAEGQAILSRIGVLVMAFGISFETVADSQKSSYKSRRPDHYCDTGLYRLVRCPNYLGEILFWSGSYVSAISVYEGVFSWLFASVGYLCIFLIMLGSTKRLELTQDERYGHLDEYKEYVRRVPVLFPFLPIYSLKRIKVILE